MDFREKSWWLETLPADLKANEALESSEKADVAIIGGGYTGLSTGYHLKLLEPKLDVRILESEVCGFGASGRNGGFSMTLFGLTKGITKFRFGDDKAKAAQLYMEEAVDYLHGIITANKLSCEYERNGYLLVATSPAQIKRLEHDFEIIDRWGLKGIERWDVKRLSKEFNTGYYRLGWFEPRCGILNPAKLAREMKRIAEKKGVIIYENSPVTGFEKKGDGRFLVRTEKGAIRCDYLVFATNAYSLVFPQLKSMQAPAFTHIVLTEPLYRKQLASIGWKSRAGVEDARDFIHYYRLTADNRIAMGGGDVSLTFGANFNRDVNDKIFSHLEHHITEVFPQLSGIKITRRWGGPVSITVDMSPAIGYIGNDRKAIYSLGCMGHGVSMTSLNGRTIAEMICKMKTPRTELFFVGRKTIPWPPEPIKFGISQMVRGYMKLEDRLIYK
ncbi:MAG: oxidoreductase [Spirochaetes bacterium RBG_13_51_14]|nr:MAG: oxidoreductase [Spirochaetes bacterium RBG_13_51_14]